MWMYRHSLHRFLVAGLFHRHTFSPLVMVMIAKNFWAVLWARNCQKRFMWIISFNLCKQPTVVVSLIDEEMEDKGLIIYSRSCSYWAAEPGFKPSHFESRIQTLPPAGTKLQWTDPSICLFTLMWAFRKNGFLEIGSSVSKCVFSKRPIDGTFKREDGKVCFALLKGHSWVRLPLCCQEDSCQPAMCGSPALDM